MTTPSTPTFPELVTPRLRLRQLQVEDAPSLLAIHQDSEAMRYWGSEPFADLAAAQEYVATCRTGWQLPVPVTRWALQRQADGALLGTCGLFNWDPYWRKCALGYELARSAWGQGYMREALATLLPWAFKHRPLHRIEALIHPDNAASLALARRVGFVQEGHLRQASYWAGQYHDLVHMGLLEADLPIATDLTTSKETTP